MVSVPAVLTSGQVSGHAIGGHAVGGHAIGGAITVNAEPVAR